MKTNIAILGGGNLGTALAKGLARTDEASQKYDVTVTRRNTDLIRHLEEDGITVSSDNTSAVKKAELIVISVQPTQIEQLIEEIKPVLDPKQHIITSTIAIRGRNRQAHRIWLSDSSGYAKYGSRYQSGYDLHRKDPS